VFSDPTVELVLLRVYIPPRFGLVYLPARARACAVDMFAGVKSVSISIEELFRYQAQRENVLLKWADFVPDGGVLNAGHCRSQLYRSL
jgi:hypothetical protein